MLEKFSNMAYPLEFSVLTEISKTFTDAVEADYVERVLSSATLPMGESAPPPRVHIALLWLSAGHIKRFDHELSAARSDWRDTLLRAGLAGANWREVMQHRGVDCLTWNYPSRPGTGN